MAHDHRLKARETGLQQATFVVATAFLAVLVAEVDFHAGDLVGDRPTVPSITVSTWWTSSSCTAMWRSVLSCTRMRLCSGHGDVAVVEQCAQMARRPALGPRLSCTPGHHDGWLGCGL
jgi:hypothetical protein